MYLLHSFRVASDRSGLIPGDVSSYLTGAAIGAAVAGTGAAIAAVAATARSAADNYASGDKQDHGSRWVLLTTLTTFVGNHAPTTCVRGYALRSAQLSFSRNTGTPA